MALSTLNDIDVLHTRLIAAGESWSDLNAAASAWEDTTKTLLAEITLNFFVAGIEGPKQSRVEAEMRALASSTYRAHLTQAVEARRLANKARVGYDGMRVYCELVRTAESTRRAEMRL